MARGRRFERESSELRCAAETRWHPVVKRIDERHRQGDDQDQEEEEEQFVKQF